MLFASARRKLRFLLWLLLQVLEDQGSPWMRGTPIRSKMATSGVASKPKGLVNLRVCRAHPRTCVSVHAWKHRHTRRHHQAIGIKAGPARRT